MGVKRGNGCLGNWVSMGNCDNDGSGNNNNESNLYTREISPDRKRYFTGTSTSQLRILLKSQRK